MPLLAIEVELIAFGQLAPAEVAAALAGLPAHEQARALRYQRLAERAAFVSCRTAVRRRLGLLAGMAPHDVPIVRDEHGRPCCHLDGLPHFSISHGSQLAAIGWCEDVLGVDLELAAPEGSDDAGLASLILPAQQQAIYSKLPAAGRADYLMRQFNAREAVLKAMGCGMHVEPHRLQSDGVRFTSPPWKQVPAQQWQVHQQLLHENWLLAVAVAAPAEIHIRITETRPRQNS